MARPRSGRRAAGGQRTHRGLAEPGAGRSDSRGGPPLPPTPDGARRSETREPIERRPRTAGRRWTDRSDVRLGTEARCHLSSPSVIVPLRRRPTRVGALSRCSHRTFARPPIAIATGRPGCRVKRSAKEIPIHAPNHSAQSRDHFRSGRIESSCSQRFHRSPGNSSASSKAVHARM